MLKLDYHPPYNWQALLDFLAVRATPGVEKVQDGKYMRSFEFEGEYGVLEVSHNESSESLHCKLTGIDKKNCDKLIHRIDRIFDLSVDPKSVIKSLRKDSKLWKLVKNNPGLRVPGCWDGFEIAVRAIVGQQISVVGATTVMGKIVQLYGTALPRNLKVSYLFPKPEILANLDIESLPMPRARAATIARVAQAVADDELELEANKEPELMIEQLLSIKGIGPWTAQYIAMRALAHPDALLEGDLVLEKKAARLYDKGDRMKTSELLKQAEKWRPWRAYAAMHIWNLI